MKEQLVAQKINFAPAVAILPKEYAPSARADLVKYAGQPVDTGVKAQIYASDFIGTHLKAVANGRTYSEVSSAYLKNPKNQQLAIQRNSLFMGTMLRSSLLQAYGWDQVANYTLYAAYGLTIAMLLILEPSSSSSSSRRAASASSKARVCQCRDPCLCPDAQTGGRRTGASVDADRHHLLSTQNVIRMDWN